MHSNSPYISNTTSQHSSRSDALNSFVIHFLTLWWHSLPQDGAHSLNKTKNKSLSIKAVVPCLFVFSCAQFILKRIQHIQHIHQHLHSRLVPVNVGSMSLVPVNQCFLSILLLIRCRSMMCFTSYLCSHNAKAIYCYILNCFSPNSTQDDSRAFTELCVVLK